MWGGAHVSDSVLRVSVKEIRAALGDAAGSHSISKRWAGRAIASCSEAPWRNLPPWRPAPWLGARATLRPWRGGTSRRRRAHASSSSSVGKREWGRRRWSRCSCAAWAPGASRGRRGASASSTRGGGSDLPFVEALGRLDHAPAVLAGLRRYAPLWLAQLPGLVSEPELERLQGRLHGTTCVPHAARAGGGA